MKKSISKKRLRYAFIKVISVAESVDCESLHHKKDHQHGSGNICPAEYEIGRLCYVLRQHMKDIGLTG